MRNRFGILRIMFLIILVTLFSTIQKANAVLITFENDVFTPRGQGPWGYYDPRMLSLTSVDSPLAHFQVPRESMNGLSIITEGGNKYLGHYDDQGFGITITFDVLVSSISIDYLGRGTYYDPSNNWASFLIFKNNNYITQITLPVYPTFNTFSYSGGPFDQVLVGFIFNYGTGLNRSNENEFIDNVNFTPVPEPATMLLLGSGLIGLAGYGRKKFLKK